MRQIRLTRIAAHPEHGTFGTWVVDGQPMAVTLEPYWRDNARSISSISDGVYRIFRHKSPTYGNCFMVDDVQHRSHILIHAGNWDDNTEGCILLGEKYEQSSDGRWMISESRNAINEFMERMSGINEATLTIREEY